MGTSPLHLSLLVGVSHWLLPGSQQVVSEPYRFIMGSCVDSKGISGYLAEIVCQSQNSVWTARGIKFGGVDRFGNSSRVSL